MSENKESILILFNERKKETPNTFFFEKKFSIQYKTKIIYTSDYLKQSNHSIASAINSVIKKENISVVLFQGDGLSIIDEKFIKLIDSNVKKGMLVWDDIMYHHTNRITASACDFILSGCPLSTIKFQEVGYHSFWLPVESNNSIFKDLKEKKIYDVLFFGRQKNNRSEYIKYLRENNIKVFECGPYDEISNTFEKLNKLINQSKIVLNFTEQDNTKYIYNPISSFKRHYSLKGRVYYVGLCGSLCISEFNPSAELIFNQNELPYFKNKDECLKIIKDFLTDNFKLVDATDKYKKRCMEFEDSSYIKKTKIFIDQVPKGNQEVKPNIPYWYEFIFFKKNIMLRFRLNKFLSFFRQVFDSMFTTKYKSKILLPVFLLLSLLTSILFILKFPFAKFKP